MNKKFNRSTISCFSPSLRYLRGLLSKSLFYQKAVRPDLGRFLSDYTIAALGGIESLLSASVADGMTDTRHDSNQELIGQGIANLLCPLFGGIAATGAIARTAANIRNAARSPVSGLVHSGLLLLVALIAAPYAGYIPLAALSGILITVAVRMAEWEDFHSLGVESEPGKGSRFWLELPAAQASVRP